MTPFRRQWIASLLAMTLISTCAAAATAQDNAPAAGDDLSVEQARLADRYDRLEQVVGRLAELSASTDPRRARLLRDAIAQSREQDVNVRFESIVKLLEDERLSAAANNQTELRSELDALLSLLLKADRDEQIASQRERIQKYLKEVGRLIRMQKGIRARTEGGDESSRLSKDQQQVADDTGKLSGEIDENEREVVATSDDGDGSNDDPEDTSAEDGEDSSDSDAQPSKPADAESSKPAEGEPSKPESSGEKAKPGQPTEGSESDSADSPPSDGQPSEGSPSPGDAPPSDSKPSQGSQPSPSQGSPQDGQSGGQPSDEQQRQQQRPTDRAGEKLQSAQQKMEEARHKLEEAQRDGAAEKQREALRELEQAKAELERVLRQLREEEMERTLTQLAARFRKMLDQQVAVYEGTQRLGRVPEASRDHDDEIEAARLSRQESLIVREADKAMLLLREEGSSVAFPEAVEQMRDDMQQVVERLAARKVGMLTQGLEEDIIAALEEMIAALEKAIKDLEKNRTPPGQAAAPGQAAEPPLVGKLGELKMIRALQMRINIRTERYGKMIGGEQAETQDLLEALEGLSERQQRVHRATYDLSQGSND